MADQLIVIDRTTSTAEIDGRRFPAVALICPLAPEQEDFGDEDRSLAAGGGDQSVYIPAENGLLFRVEEARNDSLHGLMLDLNSRTCKLGMSLDDQIYLPWSIAIQRGNLVLGDNLWRWADPWWVVEMIDMVSTKPFTPPEGPLAQLVPLDYFTKEACGA